MGEWNRVKIIDLASRITSGGTPLTKHSEYYDGDIPWLNTKEIKNCRIFETEKCITELGLNNSSAKFIDSNSVIVAMYGATAGKIAINKIPLTTNQACCNITIDDKKADYNFIYYLLLSSFARLDNLTSGAAQQNLNVGLISNLEIVIPEIKEQKAIAEVLSSLDDKIDLLHRQNKTLENLAQTLFRQWFIEGEDTEAYSFEELVYSISIKHSFNKDKVIFLNTSDIYNGKVLHNEYSNVIGLPGQAKKSIQKDDILFTEIRPANKRFAYIDFDADDYVVSTKLMVLRSKGVMDTSTIYLFLKLPDTLNYLQMLAESRSGTFPQITFKHLKNVEIFVPKDKKLLAKYTNIFKDIITKTFSNHTTIRTLENTRDTLLPKLMSGEVRVKI